MCNYVRVCTVKLFSPTADLSLRVSEVNLAGKMEFLLQHSAEKLNMAASPELLKKKN